MRSAVNIMDHFLAPLEMMRLICRWDRWASFFLRRLMGKLDV